MALTPFGRRGLLFGIVLFVGLVVLPALVGGASFAIRFVAVIVAFGSMMAALMYWLSLLWES